MAASLYVTHTIAEDSGKVVGGIVTTISGSSRNYAETNVAASQTNTQFDVEIDVTNAKVISIVSDADCTIKTNNSSTPADTLTLVANKPLVWDETQTKDAAAAIEKFLSADVTTLYVTTGAIGAAGATIKILWLK